MTSLMSIIALATIRWLKLCRFLSVHSPKLQMLSFLLQSVLIFVEFKLNVGGAITLSLACTLCGNDSANIVSSCHFCSSLSYAGFLDGKLCQHSLLLCGLLNFNWTSAECDSTSSIREFTRTCSNGKRITQISISYVSCDWDLFLAVSSQLSLNVNLWFFFPFRLSSIRYAEFFFVCLAGSAHIATYCSAYLKTFLSYASAGC